MGTLFDYLNWRGDLPFSQAPLNEVDSLIFSLLSYLDFDGIVPADFAEEGIPLRAAANTFSAKYPGPDKRSIGLILPKQIVPLLLAAKNTRRFQNVLIKGFTNVINTDTEIQFSATTFIIPDVGAVVAYRGTDDTLIGWKEDFNMSFLPEVPAQRAATAYLNEIAPHLPSPIYVTGHSKGGNLAVWAAVHCQPDVRTRLKQVWCNDGPGFGKGMLNNPVYIEIRPIIKFFVPQSAVIGILLEHNENYTVVKSRTAGLLQHDAFSWNISGASFIYVETVTASSKRLDRTLNEWVQKMTPEQREQFVETMFQILSVNKELTLTEFFEQSKKKGFLKQLVMPDPEVKQATQKMLGLLLELGKQNIQTTLAERMTKTQK